MNYLFGLTNRINLIIRLATVYITLKFVASIRKILFVNIFRIHVLQKCS